MGVSPRIYRLRHRQHSDATENAPQNPSPVLLVDEQIVSEKETTERVR